MTIILCKMSECMSNSEGRCLEDVVKINEDGCDSFGVNAEGFTWPAENDGCRYGVYDPKNCQYFDNGDCSCPAAQPSE